MTTIIKVCMGSACFAKGNFENLEFIKEYIKENNLDSEVEIVGSLCENKCEKGPRIIVNDKEYTKIKKDDILSMIKGV